MRILHFSDIHLDRVTLGLSRFQEISDLVDLVVDAAIEAKVDLVVNTGDLCDPDAGPVIYRALATMIRSARRLAEAKIPYAILAGNHDVMEDGRAGTTFLTPLHEAAQAMGDYVSIVEDPCVLEGLPLPVACLPYTAAPRAYDPDKTYREMTKKLGRHVIASHLTQVIGLVPGEELYEMPRGRNVTFPHEALDERAAVILQGHFHDGGRHTVGTTPMVVAGSMVRGTFGETAIEPCYYIIEAT